MLGFGDILTLGVVFLAVVLLLRSVYRNHKNGGGCASCPSCGTCPHAHTEKSGESYR